MTNTKELRQNFDNAISENLQMIKLHEMTPERNVNNFLDVKRNKKIRKLRLKIKRIEQSKMRLNEIERLENSMKEVK